VPLCLLLLVAVACSRFVNAPFVASIASKAVRLLPAAETVALDRKLPHVVSWRIATPAVTFTYGVDGDAALLPVQLLSLLHQQLFASVAFSTAMEQLEGSRPTVAADDYDEVESWGPVKEVRDCEDSRGVTEYIYMLIIMMCVATQQLELSFWLSPVRPYPT
jgi:hypothetical protein